jgi:F-type H+-transporting ATPase subunit b
MIEFNITFFIQLVNFLITLAVLNLVLYRPIRGILKRRAEQMAARMQEIEEFSQTAEEKISSYEKSLNQARREGQEVRSSFREQGYEEEGTIVEAASREAAKVVAAAREKIAAERKAAAVALQKEVEKYAGQAVEKILSKA